MYTGITLDDQLVNTSSLEPASNKKCIIDKIWGDVLVNHVPRKEEEEKSQNWLIALYVIVPLLVIGCIVAAFLIYRNRNKNKNNTMLELNKPLDYY